MTDDDIDWFLILLNVVGMCAFLGLVFGIGGLAAHVF